MRENGIFSTFLARKLMVIVTFNQHASIALLIVTTFFFLFCLNLCLVFVLLPVYSVTSAASSVVSDVTCCDCSGASVYFCSDLDDLEYTGPV